MKNAFIILIFLMLAATSCKDLLEPKPVDLLIDDLVLNEPNDVPNVEIGLYGAFRTMTASVIIAGDLTADMLIHNGTFSQFRELGVKRITASNGSASVLWSSIYNTIYIANFIIEKLPTVHGVKSAERNKVLATAHFLRGYAYFIGFYTFGEIPKVIVTDIQTNRNTPRAPAQEILDLILSDYNAALGQLTTEPTNAGFASDYAVRAALAKYYLYQKQWAQAEQFATSVIDSKKYALDTAFSNIVLKDFTIESIFEMGYTIFDDPGTDSNIGLNNLFVGRREIIPSNQEVLSLASNESGERFSSITHDFNNQSGSDNGWSVAKYGTAVADNNNIVVFRLGEMYLIRAEARTQQGNVTGTGSAQEDVNKLRYRAKAPQVISASQSQMLRLIEDERTYELAFEGHRWYDLTRTGRIEQVMPAFSSAWKDTYELWPIPQREIQNNPALVGHQNPGY